MSDRVIVDANDSPVRGFVTGDDRMKTSVVLNELCREAWQVWFVDRSGVFRSRSVFGIIGRDVAVPASHVFAVPHGFELPSDAIQYNDTALPTGGVIEYGVTSDGKYTKSIRIGGVTNATFLPEYVQGVSNVETAELLWEQARLIYLKSGKIQDFRDDQRRLNWLYLENDAVQYVSNIFDWAGAQAGDDFVREVIDVSFRVAAVDTSQTGPLWMIGDECRVYIPTITADDYSGIVTGIQYDAETYTAVVRVRAGQIEQLPTRIVEIGVGAGNRYIEGVEGSPKIIEVGV
jgi:hypothetical protein